MNSQQIKYILTVADCRSFSRAAARLFITQPSLSQYIRNAEQKLGFPVFDRSCSPVSLTPEGELFVEYARQIHSLENEFTQKLSELPHRRNDVLRVSSQISPLPQAAQNAFAEYSSSVGQAQLVVDEHDADELLTHLKNGETDAVVTVSDPHDPELETVALKVWLSVRRPQDRSYSDERFAELVKSASQQEDQG